MSDLAAVATPAPRPLRVWPQAVLVAVFWIIQLVAVQIDMPMFTRFMTGVITKGSLLLLFLILWLSNGTVRWGLRFLGLGLLFGGVALGIALRHPSFDPFGFLITTVPVAITTWTLLMMLGRIQPPLFGALPLSAVVLLTYGYFDLFRWDGLDGRLQSTTSLRWSPTPEQAFLAAKPAAAAPAPTSTWTLQPGDCAEFRGSLRDGVVRGATIGTDWKAAPPQLVWRERVGPGWSSIIVVGGFLVTQEQRGDSEAIACYSAETGKEVWVRLDPGRFTEGIAGPGPRATPTWSDGRIYALGAAGLLSCVEASSGKQVWSRSLAKAGDAPPPMWGYSASPLVLDGKVIVFIGGPKGQGVLAFDAATGAPAWTREVGKESYSSAHLVRLGGKPQIVMQDNQKLVGLSAADGSLLWETPGESDSLVPMIQPHPLPDGTLLVSFGAGMMLYSVREEGGKWTAEQKWSSKKLKPSFSDVVVRDGYAYGFDDGTLTCMDLKTGDRVWRKGRYGSGQVVLLADQGQLLVLSEKGELSLVPAAPQDPGDVLRIPVLDGKTWNHPTVVQDRIYVRNGTEMACYRSKP